MQSGWSSLVIPYIYSIAFISLLPYLIRYFSNFFSDFVHPIYLNTHRQGSAVMCPMCNRILLVMKYISMWQGFFSFVRLSAFASPPFLCLTFCLPSLSLRPFLLFFELDACFIFSDTRCLPIIDCFIGSLILRPCWCNYYYSDLCSTCQQYISYFSSWTSL